MASANLKVRQAGLHDVDIVLGILDEAAGWLKQHEIPSLEAWRILPSILSRSDLSRGVYVALVDDTAAGTFILQWSDSPFWGERPPDSGYIHKLAVRPDFAGRGIGREMLRWAEARAKSAGKRFLRLNCLAGDRKIRDYYERAGFTHRGDIVEPRGRASLYEKRLTD